MNLRRIACTVLLAIAVTMIAHAQAASSPKATFASVLDNSLSSTEKTFVPAADAMPADKYDFAPTQGEFKGVRTFGAEVKHAAVANYMFGATILGEKPPVQLAGPDGPPDLKSKEQIMKFLTDSFAYAHKAVNSVNETNILEPIKGPFGPNMTTRLALAISMIGHPGDHYGQMVEYLRMNGIVPPASRK